MNVYIYGGKDRFSATESIVVNNSQPIVNKSYKVDMDTGVLVIAYPNKNQRATELQFIYWLDVTDEKEEIVEDNTMFYVLIVASSLGGLCLLSLCFCILRGVKQRVYPDQELGDDWDNEKGANTNYTDGNGVLDTEQNQNTERSLLDRPGVIVETESIYDFYELKQVIGEGLYGEVYLCIHKTTEQKRSVEIIRKHKMSQSQQKHVL